MWASAFKINRRHLIKFNLIRETEEAAEAAAAAGAEKQSNKDESEGNGESKSNCKAPWRNQSVSAETSNTHTYTRRHTHKHRHNEILEAFYSPFCCSLLSRVRSIRNCVNKTTEAARSCLSYSPSLFLSASLSVPPCNCQSMWASKKAIHLLYSIKLSALCELIERWHHFESELLTKFDRFIAHWKGIFQ